MQFLAPFLLNEAPCLLGVADRAPGFVTNVTVGSRNQRAYAGGAPFHTVAIAMEPEPRLDGVTYLAFVVSLLDDLGGFSIAGQPLTAPVAQNDNPAHNQLISGRVPNSIDESSISKAGPQYLADFVLEVDVAPRRGAGNRDMEDS